MTTLSDLSVAQLVPHERNLRSGVGDISDLVASIGAVGVLQPLLVVPLPADHPCQVTLDTAPDGGWFQIIIGHRRHAAATQMGLATVPCLIAADEGEADRVVKMLAENVHRQGLSASEEAEGYRQLALLDWTPEQISTVTARPASRVREALTLTRLPSSVKSAADAGELDLADAALLADFVDDDKTLTRLLGKGRGWNLTHAVAEEHAKRDRKSAAERLRAELVLAGVKVTAKPAGFGYDSREAAAFTLLDADGSPLDPEMVRTLPGFAAFVEATGTPEAIVYCTDPDKHGYTRTRPTSYVAPEVAEQRVREAAERAEHETALVVAAGVRRDFLIGAFATAKAARGLQVDALRAALTDPDAIEIDQNEVPLVEKLAGCPLDAAATAGPDRLTRILVARWLGAMEGQVAHLAARRMWRSHPRQVAEHLNRLTGAGYALSPAEQVLLVQAEDLARAQDAEPDTDDVDEPDDDTADDDTGDEPDDTDPAQAGEHDTDADDAKPDAEQASEIDEVLSGLAGSTGDQAA